MIPPLKPIAEDVLKRMEKLLLFQHTNDAIYVTPLKELENILLGNAANLLAWYRLAQDAIAALRAQKHAEAATINSHWHERSAKAIELRRSVLSRIEQGEKK